MKTFQRGRSGFRLFGFTFLLIGLVWAVSVFAAGGNGDHYEQALKQLWDGNYEEAALSFDNAGDYEDANLYADYCRALALGESGGYSLAIDNLLSLGGFRDSAQQAVYYQGLSYEAMEQYEEAAECFKGHELFRDIAVRLSDYPEKILERDYAKADKYEQGKQLEKALETFKALGSYKDSSERASKIAGLINERDYEKACSLEEMNDVVEAYKAFTALGSYKDSKARAEALYEEAAYLEGKSEIENGRYADARETFSSIADYKDSSDILYMLGVIDHTNLYRFSAKSAYYEFHDKYGLINLENYTIGLPEWKEIEQITDNCFLVRKGSNCGLIDADGERLTMCNWKDISTNASEDRLTGIQGEKDNTTVSMLDAEGNVYINDMKCIGDTEADGWNIAGTPRFSHGLIRAENRDSEWGFIDKDGNCIIEFKYEDAKEFVNGYAAVELSDKWGFIDPSGSVVIDFAYSEVKPFSKDGFANVKDNSGWKVIDTSGNTVYFIDPLFIKTGGSEEETDAIKMQRMAQDIRFLIRQGKLKEAEILAEEAGDNPEIIQIFEEGKIAEAKIKYEEGDLDQAIAHVKKLTSDEAKELRRTWSIEKAGTLLDEADISGAFEILKNYEDDPETITMVIEKAKTLHDNDDLDNARDLIEKIADDEAKELSRAWSIEKAGMLLDEADISGAFEILKSYEDDPEVITMVIEKAKALHENGDLGNAIAIIEKIASDEAAELNKTWVIERAGLLYEDGQILNAIELLNPFSEDSEVSEMISLFEGQMEVHDELPAGDIQISICICTAGVLEDGHIHQEGYIGNGIKKAGEWSDIVSFDYGTGHVVGLKHDGTVVATGDNAVGQCKVEKWSSVSAVSAGNGLTIGLHTDGTVSAVGLNKSGQCKVDDWTNIKAVSAGGHHALGLKEDGTVVAVGYNEYGQCNVSDWTDIVAISAGYSHSVGLKRDGTVVSTGDDAEKQCRVSQWRNIVAISAGDYHTLGLTAEGTVVATGHNGTRECNVDNWTNIIAIAAGGQDSMAINADGVIYAAGYNDYKQIKISGYEVDMSDGVNEVPDEQPNNVYSDKETIEKVQAALNEKGYDCGTPDGDAGPKTQETIRRYRVDNGLEESTVIDDNLLRSLGIQ